MAQSPENPILMKWNQQNLQRLATLAILLIILAGFFLLQYLPKR